MIQVPCRNKHYQTPSSNGRLCRWKEKLQLLSVSELTEKTTLAHSLELGFFALHIWRGKLVRNAITESVCLVL